MMEAETGPSAPLQRLRGVIDGLVAASEAAGSLQLVDTTVTVARAGSGPGADTAIVKTRVKRLSFGDVTEESRTFYTPEAEAAGAAEADHFRSRQERGSLDALSSYSLYMDKDLRYYFQHPYIRLIVAYFVIFCNFLLFAEDPVSHSHAESEIPVVGNVFSFVVTKYPPEWNWKLGKVLIWVLAILCGMLIGKNFIHHIVLRQWTRLKMFRDEQGSWMVMFLTVIVSLYIFSHVYNFILLLGYVNYQAYHVNSCMYITNASLMKAAACGTWLGDLITALMVTDMMLQDDLYPHWANRVRAFWRRNNLARILVFWVGSIVATVLVVTLIVSDLISWDRLNRGFVATTELSRGFLASFILVMDLIIVMQDWDFPHFTTTLNVNLPGFSVSTLQWKYAKLSFTGKWFNYGIIFMVMILDLNMWKNQFVYVPKNYGQYTDQYRKIHTVMDQSVLLTGNLTLWTYKARNTTDSSTDQLYRLEDMVMNSKYMGYSTSVRCTTFIPCVLGFVLFISLVIVYGRFPPNKDGTYGGRLKKRRRSSWRRERNTRRQSPLPANSSDQEEVLDNSTLS
ncbi:transmembrane protein 117-like [Pollicipes pollicipes]|uniref:transmembrane protein 117-like n=1 Tax=Pollicipes pollicipes TaxID=41117 RepID=UPI001884EFC3|nr:transmembrane protein 117-like [Pollicipes pollicipes]